MPILDNPKHEIFAQELAKGVSAEEAHVRAGFKRNPGNARVLRAKEAISKRVKAILGEREEIHGQAVAQAIEKTGLTKQWIIETLRENAKRAMQANAVEDDEGNVVGEYRYDGAVANRALELLGKELGMFVERKEIRTGTILDDVEPGEVERLRTILESQEPRRLDS